jgi:hypothetical protein
LVTRRTTFTEIVDWIEGRLPANRARDVAEAVRDDDEAADAAAWVADFLATADRLQLETPPSDLGSRLRGLFRDPVGLAPDHGWSRARLLYDTRGAGAGVRGADAGAQTHLAFDSEAGRFVIEAAPARAGHVDLRGLLLADRPPVTAEVTLLEAGVVRRRGHSTAAGHFAFDEVPMSVDELRIAVDGLRVAARLELAGV